MPAWTRLPTHCDSSSPCIANPALPNFCHQCAHPIAKAKPRGYKSRNTDGESIETGSVNGSVASDSSSGSK